MRPIIGITSDLENRYLKLNRQYADAVEKVGACPIVLVPSYNIVDIALKVNGLLISGGDDLHPSYYSEKINYEMKIVDRDRSDFELALIYEIIKIRKPLLAICYGMQLVNVAFGGTLYQDIGLQVPMAIDHKKDGHTIRVIDNRFIDMGEFSVNSSHHQAIKSLGIGLKAIAFSADNILEAICLEDYPFLMGVQWHPERLADGLSARVFGSFVEASIGNK